jgi:hypothetical protein
MKDWEIPVDIMQWTEINALSPIVSNTSGKLAQQQELEL